MFLRRISLVGTAVASRGWANPSVTVLREMLTSQSVSITFVIKREVSFQNVAL
jgi:hypothetical protein